MFAGNIGAGDELGNGITSSMSILYDLDAAEQRPGTENVNSWDWNSNLSTDSSNYSTGHQMYEQGVNTDRSDGYNKMAYQDPWNEGYAPGHQMYDQNGYNQYASQNYNSSYNDSSKQLGQMHSSYDNYGSNYRPNYNQQGRNPHWMNTPYSPRPLAKGGNNMYQQHGLHQKNAQQSFGAASSGANYKILPSKRFSVGNVVARDQSQLGQRGILNNGFARKGIFGTYQGQQAPSLKTRLGGLGHGLIKIVNDNTSSPNKHTPLVFHDPPYQRQRPLSEQSPTLNYPGRGYENESEKPFSPTAIELVSASTDDDDCSTPSSPQVIEVKTVPIRNTIFGYKKLKFRCMRCGNRDATFNSQLTHVKSHRKPYCMQCCWIGDHALQLKAHIEKAHPKIDAGSGTTMVTSKYGRKCQVNTSVAVGLKRKKHLSKSPLKSAFPLAAADEVKRGPIEHLVRVIKTERVVKVVECEEPGKVDDECSPLPKKGCVKGSDLSEAKEAAKMSTPPTRELSRRRLTLMAKYAAKGEGMSPLKIEVAPKVEETPPSKGELPPKDGGTPFSKVRSISKGGEITASKREPFSKDVGTPVSKACPKGSETFSSKRELFSKDGGTPGSKSVPKGSEISSSKRELFSKDGGTPGSKSVPKGSETSSSKREIFSKDGGTPVSKAKSVPKDRETFSSKRELFSKDGGTPGSKSVPKGSETSSSKREIFSKDGGTPLSKAKSAPKLAETSPSKGDMYPKDARKPSSKGRIVFKEADTSPSKGDIYPKDARKPSSKGRIVFKEDEAPPSKGKIVPLEVREMPKRALRKK